MIFAGALFFLAFLLAVLRVLFWDLDTSVSEITFSYNDGAVSPAYYTEASLKIVPDYQIRSLNVGYESVYSYRTDETDGVDIDTEGVIGGEYFDRFEGVIGLLHDDLVETGGTCVGGHNLSYEMVDETGELSNEQLYLCGDYSEDVEFIRDFYFDVVGLLTEDTE